MILKQLIESYTQTDENNLVFKVNNTIENDGSLTVSDGTQLLAFTLIGTTYVKLTNAVPVGTEVIITYNTQVPMHNTDVDIVQRLNALEARCALLEKQNVVLLEALNERVPNKTFRQWLLVMEKNFGKSVIDSNSLMGIQGQSIPSEWKL